MVATTTGESRRRHTFLLALLAIFGETCLCRDRLTCPCKAARFSLGEASGHTAGLDALGFTGMSRTTLLRTVCCVGNN